jgi:hypothetical protein
MIAKRVMIAERVCIIFKPTATHPGDDPICKADVSFSSLRLTQVMTLVTRQTEDGPVLNENRK